MLWRLTLACLALAASLHAAEAPAESRLRSKVYFIPPGFIGGERAPDDPVKDVPREYLKTHGIEIPADGEATYDLQYCTLTVRAPKAVIEQIDALVSSEIGPVHTLWIELSLVEFNLDRVAELEDRSYEHLRKVAGDSWRLIDRVLVDTKNGQRSLARSTAKGRNPSAPSGKQSTTARKEPEASEHTFAPNEYGTILDVEPVTGPDGTVDLNILYHYRALAKAVGRTSEFQCQTSIALKREVPVIVQTGRAAAEDSGGASTPIKALALIARTGIVDMRIRRGAQPGARK